MIIFISEMKKNIFLFLVSFLIVKQVLSNFHYEEPECSVANEPIPTVLAVIIARNKAHTLPYFLQLFESLDYSKKSISLFIQSDLNHDSTINILQDWLALNEEEYDNVETRFDEEQVFPSGGDYSSPWTEAWANHTIKWKQIGLELARKKNFDYVWYLDADVFLNDEHVLSRQILAKKPIVAPMLESVYTYSNFFEYPRSDYWQDIEENHEIYTRSTQACHDVFMVTSCVLINLQFPGSDQLSFKYNRREFINIHLNADNIALGLSAFYAGIPIVVCNQIASGFMMMPVIENDLTQELQQLTSIKVKSLEYFPPMSVPPCLQVYLPPKIKKDTLGFDKIYFLNLERRPERKERMLRSFDELGIDAHVFKAVDGEKLTSSYMKRLGIKPLSEILHLELMRLGIVGNFLSNYFVWQDVIRNNYTKVLVMEDDASFRPNFRQNIGFLNNELQRLNLTWDFVYLYREPIRPEEDKQVSGSDMLVHPLFSYSLIVYIITKEGAQKLIDAKPLGQLINTDWFVSTMCDGGNLETINRIYAFRNLKAYAVKDYPVVPSHNFGEIGHISDTTYSPNFHDAFPDIKYDSAELERFMNLLPLDSVIKRS